VLDRFSDKILPVSGHVVVACSGRAAGECAAARAPVHSDELNGLKSVSPSSVRAVVQKLGQELSNGLRHFKLTYDRQGVHLSTHWILLPGVVVGQPK
jgi:hypothetical protein